MDLELDNDITVLTPMVPNIISSNDCKNEYILPNNADGEILDISDDKVLLPKPAQNINFTIPPHVMGRDVNNPEDDMIGTGKRSQKPRLGVKVPYRNLTSQIVTQDEIAQELLERSLKKHPYHDPPEGGDIFFAMKLTHRLANRIAPSTTPGPTNVELKNDEKSSLLDEHILPAGYTVNTDKTEIPDHSELLAILEGDEEPDLNPDVENELSLEHTATKSTTVLETVGNIEERIKKNVVEQVKPTSLEPPKTETGEVLPVIPLPAPPRRQPQSHKRGPQYQLIKLYPELEKELALKQLMEFSKKEKPKIDPNIKIKKIKNLAKDNNVKTKKRSENNNNVEAAKALVKVPGKRGRKRKIDSVAPVGKIKKSKVMKTNQVTGKKLVPKMNTKIKVKPRKKLTTRDERIINKEKGYLKTSSKKKLVQEKLVKPKLSKSSSKVPTETLLNGSDVSGVHKKLEVVKKKVGRPRLRPTDVIIVNKEKTVKQEKQTLSNGETVTPIKKPKVKKPSSRTMREINRLLGDEGAINMLYSIEQKRSPGSEPKRKMMLPSYRRKRKDLLLKTKLVKNAVLRLSSTPPQKLGKNSLRHQMSQQFDEEETPQRKISTDSHESHHSVTSPTHSRFAFPAKIVIPADASRIIRRHSSSSSYSSRSNSPRRMSIDGDRSPAVFTPPLPIEGSSSQDTSLSDLSKKGVTSQVTDKVQSLIDSGASTSTPENKSPVIMEVSERAERLISEKCKELNIQPERTELLKKRIEYKKSVTTTNIIKKNISKITPKLQAALNKKISTSSVEGENVKIAKKKGTTTEMVEKSAALNSCLAETVRHFFNTSGTNTSPATPSTSTSGVPPPIFKKTSLITTSSVNNSAETADAEKKKEGEEKQRYSARQNAARHSFKEISLRRYDHLVQIILTPVSTKLKNALNVQILKELITALNHLKKDDTCRTVLLTSTGNVFCQGVDIFSLIQHTPDKRKSAALELAAAVKDFVKTLATFAKPIIAGVHGAAVGLGVTMLPLFDMVFASDKATFHTPYAKLGQVPEGAATITLPTMLGNAATSELLFACRKLTASEALQFGLVTRILWPDTFQEELIPLIRGIASQSSQSMDATKALLRKNLCTNLEETLLTESHLLVQHWSSAECQANFQELFKSLVEEVLAQKSEKIQFELSTI